MASLSLLMLDIDHFKKFNDTWGHQAGDHVLKEVARVVRDQCRKTDIVARYGGEELSVILPGTDAKGALLLAERIREEVATMRSQFEGHELSVTLSIGISSLNQNIQDKEQLIKLADEALYRSKESGRNCVTTS
jgi:diguanylate cyclase (GGDEF)-like protein